MIHQLALATNPQLLEKLSAITVEEHLARKAKDLEKLKDLAAARGITPPMVAKPRWDAAAGKMVEEMVPDWENLRMDKPRRVAYGLPRGGAGANEVGAGLVEKEIQKKHTPITPLKKLRHKTVGGMKRFWGGQNALGGKWRNRAALAGGLGAVGLGIKSYLDSNRLANPAVAQQQLQPQYAKMGAFPYVQDAANIPKPPSQPKVPAPGPGVKGGGNISSSKTPGPLGAPRDSVGGSEGGKTSLSAYVGEKRADDAMLPVLAGGLGGIGGWALGDKVLKPMLEAKEQSLAEAIVQHQKNMARVKGAKKVVPIGAAAAGALILAALAAIKARQDEQANQSYPAPYISTYDPSGSGFVPNNATYPGFY
jgi:hypothetical protein